MKKAIKYFSFGLSAVLALSACSDQFLQDKKNYDNVTTDVYNYVEGANARLNDIYGWCLPQVADLTTGTNYLSVSIGNNDAAGGATEEYAGFTIYTDPQIALSSMGSSNGVPDYFMGAHNNIQNSVYGRIRNINDFIKGVNGSSLSQEDKNIMLGQAYFFRAWCYYNLVKWYGGVPLVKEVLEPVKENFTPRATTKETIQFICSDLDLSARLLAEKTMKGGWTGEDWGRVSTGTALALKGRVLLLWASPLFMTASMPVAMVCLRVLPTSTAAILPISSCRVPSIPRQCSWLFTTTSSPTVPISSATTTGSAVFVRRTLVVAVRMPVWHWSSCSPWLMARWPT